MRILKIKNTDGLTVSFWPDQVFIREEPTTPGSPKPTVSLISIHSGHLMGWFEMTVIEMTLRIEKGRSVLK